MELDKATLVNIALMIHMALTGMMLFKLFKLKNATGGQLIISFIALVVPIIGPSALVYYYDNLLKKKQKEEAVKKQSYTSKKKKSTK